MRVVLWLWLLLRLARWCGGGLAALAETESPGEAGEGEAWVGHVGDLVWSGCWVWFEDETS